MTELKRWVDCDAQPELAEMLRVARRERRSAEQPGTTSLREPLHRVEQTRVFCRSNRITDFGG